MKKLFLYNFVKCITVLTFCASLIISCNRSAGSEQEEEGASEMPRVSALAAGSIVYVELDSLTENFLMTRDLAAELEEKMGRMETDLNNRQRRFQTSVNDFQNRMNRGLETRTRLAEIQEQLAREEQQLMQLAESYRMEMAEEQMVMQRKIIQAIMDYLKEYNKEKGYKYILGNAFDAKILYADPSLDITAEVLDGMNAKYRAENR